MFLISMLKISQSATQLFSVDTYLSYEWVLYIWKKIIAVIDTTSAVAQGKPDKKKLELEIWRRCLHPSYPDTDNSISVVKTWCPLSITEHKINEGERTLFAKISDNFNFRLNCTIKTTLTVNFRGESLPIRLCSCSFYHWKGFSLLKERHS